MVLFSRCKEILNKQIPLPSIHKQTPYQFKQTNSKTNNGLNQKNNLDYWLLIADCNLLEDPWFKSPPTKKHPPPKSHLKQNPAPFQPFPPYRKLGPPRPTANHDETRRNQAVQTSFANVERWYPEDPFWSWKFRIGEFVVTWMFFVFFWDGIFVIIFWMSTNYLLGKLPRKNGPNELIWSVSYDLWDNMYPGSPSPPLKKIGNFTKSTISEGLRILKILII